MPYLRENPDISAAAACRHTQLSFSPLALCHIPQVDAMLASALTKSCDFTVGGLFMWKDMFDYEYCIVADTLFIKSLSEDGSGRTAFLVPVGPLSETRKVELVLDYCRRNGIAPLFTAVPDDMLADICGARRPSRIVELPDWADYVYDAHALAALTGKAYNKKRNHVNRFISDNQGYSFELITTANIADLHHFLDTCGMQSDKSDNAMAGFELMRCREVIDNYESYGFDGALLRMPDGRVAAFTMGELRGDTLVLHIEKIDHSVSGAGETINKLFAEHMVGANPTLRYINREDDAGDAGLRKAKLSYHPAFMVKKYNVEFVI